MSDRIVPSPLVPDTTQDAGGSVNEEEMARALEEGIRRHNTRVANSQTRSFLGCLLVTAIFVVGFIVLITWNPGG